VRSQSRRYPAQVFERTVVILFRSSRGIGQTLQVKVSLSGMLDPEELAKIKKI
jgi:hypothetical protein